MRSGVFAEDPEGGLGFARTGGPVCAPHVPENASQFASENAAEKNCTVLLHALTIHRVVRDLTSGFGQGSGHDHDAL
jgi:hypothetical protein